MQDAFLQVAGVNGESQDANHKNWIDIESYTWGASQPHSMASGGGAGAGKAEWHDLSVVAKIDKAYPTLLKFCATGKHIGEVKLELVKAGGSPMTFVTITLSDVMVTAGAVSGSSGNSIVTVNYSFQAARIKVQYWEQTAQGSKGAETQMGFNVKENKEM